MAKIIDPDLLTYAVNGTPTTENLRFDTTAKTIEAVAGGNLVAKDGMTGQCLFTKIKELIHTTDLRKYKLPVQEMIHDESMELINGWTFKNEATLKLIRDCGIAYVSEAGVTTAEFACFVTLGQLPAGAADITTALYFTQSSATNASTSTFTHINTGATFGVNELVQIYSDTNGDGTPDYDYRSYAKIFLRPAGYTYDESSNIDIGYPALTYKKYNFPITCAADAGVTVDDATLAGFTGMSITWYAAPQSYSLGTNGPYNYHVNMVANGRTYDEMYSWVQWRLRQASDIDAGAGNRTGRVAAALVRMDGETLKTLYQAGIGGVHISSVSASSYNNVQEADSTNTLRSYPYTAALTAEFDSYLQADGADAKFWIYDAATYPGAGATELLDASGNPMTGTVTSGSIAFSYTWTANKNWVGVALGKGGAKVAFASGVIEQSTGNKAVFVSGVERWYKNPA